LNTVHVSRNNNVLVIRDKKTGNEYKIEDNSIPGALTSAYMSLFKSRTNSNVVGFYILGGRDLYGALYRNRQNNDHIDLEKDRLEFRKKNYKVLTNVGYDEYYLLRIEGFDDEGEFEVSDSTTLRGLANAFAKHSASRKNSRVVLNRFIGIIS
jgi:hypothetical protein